MGNVIGSIDSVDSEIQVSMNSGTDLCKCQTLLPWQVKNIAHFTDKVTLTIEISIQILDEWEKNQILKNVKGNLIINNFLIVGSMLWC